MNTRILLLTGATGTIGQPLLSALCATGDFNEIHVIARDPASVPIQTGVTVHRGDLADTGWNGLGLPNPDVILHAAANTYFRGTPENLNAINQHGTARLLEWAESLPRKPRFIHLSTCCVAGTMTGDIPEKPLTTSPEFVNAYEQSKWLAEQRVLNSPLMPEVVRIATVAGAENDGRLARPGALQTSLRWFRRGLLPLIPGDTTTRVDLISTDLVVVFLLRLLERTPVPNGIYHLTAGQNAITLGQLIKLTAGFCRSIDPRWQRQQIIPPSLCSPAVFTAFRESITRSGDALFTEVLASADAFLPVLMHPKSFATTATETVWGGPLPCPPPEEFVSRIITQALAST